MQAKVGAAKDAAVAAMRKLGQPWVTAVRSPINGQMQVWARGTAIATTREPSQGQTQATEGAA
jgi:hypothetical protein